MVTDSFGRSTVQEEQGLRPTARTSIELFTGGGGLAWAMHKVGFRHLLVNEIEPRACETLRINAAADLEPSRAGLDQSVIAGRCSRATFIRWTSPPGLGQVDVVAGGVPCQPWSLGGVHKGYDDTRNLWPELFRCVRETRPRAVIAENVRGLLRPSFKPYYEYILRELEAPFEERVNGEDWRDHDKRLQKILRAEGNPAERYHVWCLPVNAADYGVPQVRQRVFVIAFRKDLNLGDWKPPQATHSELSLLRAQAEGSYWEEHRMPPLPAGSQRHRLRMTARSDGRPCGMPSTGYLSRLATESSTLTGSITTAGRERDTIPDIRLMTLTGPPRPSRRVCMASPVVRQLCNSMTAASAT